MGPALACSLSCTGPEQDRENERRLPPNVILIMADDMGYECLGTYGSAEYDTPNLDRLAEKGVRMDHCYAQPLCTPSRVKIMTGKYNARNYTYFGYLNPGEKTFGNMMKEAGYATCIAGKWQLNGIYHDLEGCLDRTRPYHFGFDEYCLWQLDKTKNEGRERYGNPLIVQNEKELGNMQDKYGPDVFCDYILDYMERKKDTNFFVYYPMVLVHSPFVPTPESEEWADTSLRYKSDTAFFSDMMHYTDKIVGRITGKLESLGLFEHTLLIFTTDNGTHRSIYSDMRDGTTIRGGKGLMTDVGTRVPMIARWKGHTLEGAVLDAPVDFSDFLPTLAGLAGHDPGDEYGRDGKNFLSLITGSDGEPKEYIYMYYEPDWGSFPTGEFVRDRQYKLYGDGRFFDVLNDPLEKEPLDGRELTPRQSQLKNRFREILKRKQAIENIYERQ